MSPKNRSFILLIETCMQPLIPEKDSPQIKLHIHQGQRANPPGPSVCHWS
ncbi:UNVERIFIED_CONTAM: hypothetical protein FKN15_007200 [Acipenser sinensis]